METLESFLRMMAYVIFFVVLPVIVIYFRVLNKIGTGFAVGVIITSFIVGMLVAGSIQEDPVDEFVRIINTGDEEQSKTALMRVVQLGEDAFYSIDERRIENTELYERLLSELRIKYPDIAERYYLENRGPFGSSCDDLEELEARKQGLIHSIRMLHLTEIVGGDKPVPRAVVEEEFKTVRDELAELNDKCSTD